MNFHISHNGCEPTLFEMEKIKQNLINAGFTFSEVKAADIVIFLSCTFTAQKEDETNNFIENYKNLNKTLIVTGCFLQKEVFEGSVKYIKLKNLLSYLSNNKKIHQTNFLLNTPIITISEGCTGKCAFCSIKAVKGKHRSIDQKLLLQQIQFLSENYQCVKLVGQDIAAYGTDTEGSLVDLLKEILSAFPTIKIKLGSLNPKYLMILDDQQLEIFANERIVGNIHIPVQSASNSVLKQMKRDYTIENFLNLYDTLSSLRIKNISTDIIAGFPQETENDHNQNLELLSKKYFSFAEIFMFESRPNTVAAKMEEIPLNIKKRRVSELIVQHIDTYSKYNNVEIESLINNKQIFNTNINFNLNNNE